MYFVLFSGHKLPCITRKHNCLINSFHSRKKKSNQSIFYCYHFWFFPLAQGGGWNNNPQPLIPCSTLPCKDPISRPQIHRLRFEHPIPDFVMSIVIFTRRDARILCKLLHICWFHKSLVSDYPVPFDAETRTHAIEMCRQKITEK